MVMRTVLKTSDNQVCPYAVLNLKILHKEGLKAICDIEIAHNPYQQTHPIPPVLSIWIDDIHQFTGHTTGVLSRYTPHTCKVELTQMVHTPFTTSIPHSDDYFSTPNEHLPYITCFDRLTGTRHDSHILKAAHTMIVSDRCVLDYHTTQQPLPIGVELTVQAKWLWQSIHWFDVWASVKAQCQGVFATLTPDAFIRKWEKALGLAPQTGYRVLHNRLSVTKPIYVSFGKRRLKGGVIDGECVVEAVLQKRCQETKTCVMGGQHCQTYKRLHLRVPLSTYDQTEFFTTSTGERWFERACLIARNYFYSLNRQKKITCTMVLSADEMARLNVDTQLIVPGYFQGKIISYSITNQGKGYICAVTLCDHTLIDDNPLPTLAPLSAQSSSDQSPSTNFIEDLDMVNLFDQQKQYLTKSPSAQRIPVTAVYFCLKDLRAGRSNE